MNHDNRDEFVDQFEEAGEVKTIRSAGIRLRNRTGGAVRMVIQAAPPVARHGESGPWTPAYYYTFDAAAGRLVRAPHRTGSPFPQIVVPDGGDIVVSRDLYAAIHQVECQADGCTRTLSCRDVTHSPRKIVGGLAPGLELVSPDLDALPVPQIHPALTPQPPAPPPAAALDDLLLRQVQGGAQ